MKTPLWFPQSFFARTLWMVLIVVLFSKVLTLVYLMTNEDVLVDRQYSHGAALTLRAYWAADLEDRDRIGRAAGLQLVAEQNVPRSEYHWPYTEIFQRQMRDELGDDTEVRVRIQPSTAIWVRAPNLGPDWVQVPLYAYPLRGQRIWSVLGWFLGIGLLSTGAAWIFVSQLNLPLKRLVFAARQIGKGRRVRLPISDTPSEMTEVYRAFNQMAEDVEQAGRERELMLAGVSHDLRTPLTRLRLSLELMASDDELTEDMIRDVEDMNAILDQFLAFVRDGSDEPVETTDLAELIREVVAYALPRAAELGKTVDFSLTTNATLLTPELVDWFDAHRFALTVSMDGPRALHDANRKTVGGRGTYDVVAAKVRMLLARYDARPVGVRVTLTRGVTDVLAIHDHLKNDLGFAEVGFGPATSGPSIRAGAEGSPCGPRGPLISRARGTVAAPPLWTRAESPRPTATPSRWKMKWCARPMQSASSTCRWR